MESPALNHWKGVAAVFLWNYECTQCKTEKSPSICLELAMWNTSGTRNQTNFIGHVKTFTSLPENNNKKKDRKPKMHHTLSFYSK